MNVHFDPGHEARGNYAESRFIYLANHQRPYHLRGFVRIERAVPILDVRGVDAFVYHYRGCSNTTPKRIPVQFKSGFDMKARKNGHSNGMTIPIVPINIEISARNALDRIRCLLDSHERQHHEYSEVTLRSMELTPPTQGEAECLRDVLANRSRYTFDPVSPMEYMRA